MNRMQSPKISRGPGNVMRSRLTTAEPMTKELRSPNEISYSALDHRHYRSDYGDESVSVAIDEVKPQDWAEKVYRPDIADNWDNLYKKPGTIHLNSTRFAIRNSCLLLAGAS
jgi:hypothetical protein